MAKILVMDDEASIRLLLRTALESAGHKVLEAETGQAGIALYRRESADVVITDIFMPDLNGLDTIIELTREFLNVKVIAISGGQGESGLLDTAKLLGARQTLRKPFGIPELLRAVQYELAH